MALEEKKRFNESTLYNPSSPYSASKAGSDHLVRAWNTTYGLPTVITNCSNNYGPRQHVEKLIPKSIDCAIKGLPIELYGDGLNIRDWLYVNDHVDAINLIVDADIANVQFCLGGGNEISNFNLINKICDILDEIKPKKICAFCLGGKTLRNHLAMVH